MSRPPSRGQYAPRHSLHASCGCRPRGSHHTWTDSAASGQPAVATAALGKCEWQFHHSGIQQWAV